MEKFETVMRGVSEAVTEEELREIISRENFSVYCGYEPSGKIHFGHMLTVNKLIDFQKIGARTVVLLANMHAYLNDKGSLEEIRKIAEYNKSCFIALGLDPKKTEFLLGSDFQLKPDYTTDVMRMALRTTLLRAKRSMTEIARHMDDPDVAQVIYPLMQAVDIAHLKADVAVGGTDQRKVHMIARENLPLLGYRKPVCVHTPLLHGLDGSDKMSSSKANFISVDDAPEVIRDKLMKAFCPPKQTDDNPVIEYAEHMVFPKFERLEIDRPLKYGGHLDVESPKKLKEMYRAGELHPMDLKKAVSEAVVRALDPVRKYFDKHPKTARSLFTNLF